MNTTYIHLSIIYSKVNMKFCLCVLQNIQAEKEALTEGREKTPKYHRTEDGFIRIGEWRDTETPQVQICCWNSAEQPPAHYYYYTLIHYFLC